MALWRFAEERAYMNSMDDRERSGKLQISRFMFAMFDMLGFSKWIESVRLQAVLNAYYLLMERAVVRANEKGDLSAVQTRRDTFAHLIRQHRRWRFLTLPVGKDCSRSRRAPPHACLTSSGKRITFVVGG